MRNKNCINCIHYHVCHTIVKTIEDLNNFLKKYPYNQIREECKEDYNNILKILLKYTVCSFYKEKEDK